MKKFIKWLDSLSWAKYVTVLIVGCFLAYVFAGLITIGLIVIKCIIFG